MKNAAAGMPPGQDMNVLSKNIRLLHEQDELLTLLDGCGALVLGDSMSAACYPDPMTRPLDEIDLFVKREWFPQASLRCGSAGYLSFSLPDDGDALVHYVKNGITVHIHSGFRFFGNDEKNEMFNSLMETEPPEEAKIDRFSIPVPQWHIQGLLQLASVRLWLQKNRIPRAILTDWAMFANARLPDEKWPSFREKTDLFGLTDTAKAVTSIANVPVTWCGGPSNNLRYLYVMEDRAAPGKPASAPSPGLWPRVRHLAYTALRRSPLRGLCYGINDLWYILSLKRMGPIVIGQKDREKVEKNVTFIYKSFNRQRLATRLYYSIRSCYPNVRIIIADDSEKPLELPDVIRLPFNSGLSKGLIAALEKVETPFVVRLDDDMLLTPRSNFHKELDFLLTHPQVDLVAVMADHKKPKAYAEKFARMRWSVNLLIPTGTVIDGKTVAVKVPNCFLARTEKMRLVGYDPNIRMNEHAEFFTRAAGQMVCVLDPESCVMHCHNRFEKRGYENYRNDVEEANQYILGKHASRHY